MVYEDIAVNKRNTFLLMFFFIIVISGLGYLLGYIYGDPYTGVIIGAAYSFFSVFTSYFYSDRLVVAFAGAVEADYKIERQLHNSVESMALAAGLPKPKVYIMENGSINAFATGRDPKHAAVAVTRGALMKLDKFELEAVIAHEMSHIKNYDILVGTVSAVLVGTIIMLSDFTMRRVFYGGYRRRSAGGGRIGIIIFIVAILAAVLAPIVAQVINFAVSREREYMADAQGVLLNRYPAALIKALEKIKADAESLSDESINKGASHLYFNVPSKLRANLLFATHPPIEKRIARLQKM